MSRFFKITSDDSANFLRASVIVLGFAVVHALVCMLLHDTRVGDGFFLTILTIAMIYAIIKFYRSPIDVFLGMAFLGCFAGYYIGSKWGDFLQMAKPQWGVANNMIVTFFTTIVLGFATVLVVATRFKKNDAEKETD